MGLIGDAFAELARRWRPLLDAFDACGVDVCYEIHPGEDLFDGSTFERFLAACVNIIPQIGSIYRWEGEIEETEECLLVIKSTTAAFERVRDAIGELHSYELPECIAISIEDGSMKYLNWIQQSVK